MEWIKANRDQLRTQATQFSTGIGVQGPTLNLTASEISGFATVLANYVDELDAVTTTKAAADIAYETFMTEKTLIVKLMRKYNQRMQNAAGITNAKRAEIGIPIPSGSTTVEPKIVTGLVATAFENGDVKLKWNRSGNAQSVIFNIETSDDSVNWSLLTTTTSVRSTLSGFAPGEVKYFRIVATRGTLHATASDPVVIYSGSGGGSLTLAA
ncbi:MAG: hypothetical protein K8R88_02590 [Armatimonadetes bacterium]|nr:hypothetical protein [Armatimonadota bacterium]